MRAATLLVLCLLPAVAAAQAVPVQVLHRFASSPSGPDGALVQVSGGDFYGVTSGSRSIFRMTPGGQVTEVVRLPTNRTPQGALVLASDGWLYGTAQDRDLGAAEVFRFDPITGERRTVHALGVVGFSSMRGLVAVGGSLYGVAGGALFRLDVATGLVVIDIPSVPTLQSLELGADGLLYGVVANRIYSLDPATDAVTLRRQLTSQEGIDLTGLTLGTDGALYGSARSGGPAGAGTLFRYAPASNQFDVLHALTPGSGDGRSPGPIVAGADGHFYGLTDEASVSGQPRGTVFRLRDSGGGAYIYETLYVSEDASSGAWSSYVELTPGADGLIYGYGQSRGPTGNGTLFRFDPSSGGPPGNPSAFTVVHAFEQVGWRPSTPVPAADGYLYGLTLRGGAADRGRVYRLNATTGVVTLLGSVPGTSETPARDDISVPSPLVAGPDGMFYATVRTGPSAYSIVRVDPATGTATVVVGPLSPDAAPVDLVRTPAGVLYGVVRSAASPRIARFDPSTNLVTTVAQLSAQTSFPRLPLTVTSDGQIYFASQAPDPNGPLGYGAFLHRLDPAASSGVATIGFGGQLTLVDRLVETADGALYLGGTYQGAPAVLAFDRAIGAVRRVCTIPEPWLSTFGQSIDNRGRIEYMTAGSDGAIYGFLQKRSQRLFRCDPASGAVRFTSLPDALTVIGPFTKVGGLLYGATFGTGDPPSEGGSLIRLAPGAMLPPLDSDADGLPNEWESAYGLDPFDSGTGNGPADDPDGDGRNNLQELGDGTHPRGVVTRLFAEGATGSFFRTRFDFTVLEGPATVRVRFLTDRGEVVATDLRVPLHSHLDFDPSTLPGLASASFSTIIESDVAVAVSRSVTWDATGYGSHLESAIAAPSTTWYFAEGSTSGDFALFYLLQNPQAAAVTATVTYLRPSGQPPIVRTYVLPPRSRTTIVVDAEAPELASTDVSAAITATGPIVAERAMYASKPGQPFGAGHGSAGVTAPALDWFLAEGATGAFFDLFVLVANPNGTAATVEVEYLRGSGTPLAKTYTVPAQSRMTIWVDGEELPAGSGLRPLAAADVSTVVRSTNAVPIVVERSMWWPGPELTSNYWYEAHNSPGVTATATRWMVAGAEVGGADGTDTYVLIANPTATGASVLITLASDDYGFQQTSIGVPAKSRVTVGLRAAFPGIPDGRYGVDVYNPSVPIVVEAATYASPGGVTWARGGNAVATPLP